MHRPRRTLFLVLLLVAAVAGVAWQMARHRPPTVAVAAARRGLAVEAVYGTGTVEPLRWARVEPLSAGRIVAVEAREGDTVVEGQVLLRLDDREQRSRLEEMEAQSRFLRNELARLDELARRGVASTQAREKAQSELERMLAGMVGVRVRLGDYNLRAPLDGIVLRRDAEVGEVAAVGKTLFWVGQPRPLWAVVEVDEEDIPRVAPGQRTLISTDAFRGRVLEGAVREITLKGDPVNKTYRVRITLPDDTPLLVGMTVDANIVVRREEAAVLVPDTAVSGGKLFVVEDGRAVARPVVVGATGEGRAEIRSGLAEGERVVVNPPSGLTDGADVTEEGGQKAEDRRNGR